MLFCIYSKLRQSFELCRSWTYEVLNLKLSKSVIRVRDVNGALTLKIGTPPDFQWEAGVAARPDCFT